MRKRAKKCWTPSEESKILPHLFSDLTLIEIAALVKPQLPNRGLVPIRNRITVLRSQQRARESVKVKRRTIKVITTGCQTCGAETIGKFCEEHARAGFPKDMGTDDLQSLTSWAAKECRKNNVTMPKLRVAT
ncbi:MAG: hypothetical protein COB36_11535 [Alphaproteobacteria bacterium]|nr:MAG: hypothetical protein COB36_11535 [Alphaproteobacteria bacterium]